MDNEVTSVNEENLPANQSGKLSSDKFPKNIKKILIILTINIVGIISGLILIQNTQNIRKNAQSVYISPLSGSQTAPIKILFINLNNAPFFQSIIDRTVNAGFGGISPIKENLQYFGFYKVELFVSNVADYCSDTGITGASGFACDPIKIHESLKIAYPELNPNEFINIVIVESNFAGSGGSLITVGSSPNIPEDSATRNSSEIIIHELSHLLGLLDYAMGPISNDGSPNSVWSPNYLRSWYNLDGPGCSKWCSSFKPVS